MSQGYSGYLTPRDRVNITTKMLQNYCKAREKKRLRLRYDQDVTKLLDKVATPMALHDRDKISLTAGV